MITGDSDRAKIMCDAPGCKASLEAINTIEATNSAVRTIAETAEQHYGWSLDGGHFCPEHPASE